MRKLVIIGLIVIAGLAVGVYRAKLGAEETSARIEKTEAEVRNVTEEIAVLKAEEAYLSRPERIGPMARDKLGLEPSSPGQFTAPEALSQRLGEERLTLPVDPVVAPATPAPLKHEPVKPAAKAPVASVTAPRETPAQ
jgi:cell division protein FtsL